MAASAIQLPLLSTYYLSCSGVSNDRLPIGAIPLFATASPRYQESLSQLVATANATYRAFISSEEGAGFTGQVKTFILYYQES
jgi:hypothetical protein